MPRKVPEGAASPRVGGSWPLKGSHRSADPSLVVANAGSCSGQLSLHVAGEVICTNPDCAEDIDHHVARPTTCRICFPATERPSPWTEPTTGLAS
jgi:hypothetical protein